MQKEPLGSQWLLTKSGRTCEKTLNIGLLCAYCWSLEREERNKEQEGKERKKEREVTRRETDV